MNAVKNPSRTAALTLGALGVVYGDIGTSPLYTVKEIFSPMTGVLLNTSNIVGAVSAILWSLMLVVTLKYVLLILRADNRGEGGILALTALATGALKQHPNMRRILLLLGVFGATLFYGDSVITPAISVLGAMEGLEVITPNLKPYIVPCALLIMVLLFMVQSKGTGTVGKWFGPVIVLWFVVLGFVGVLQIVQTPAILAAFNPLHAIEFLNARGPHVLWVVGAIVLALTGAEALYADMGHFGRKPIQLAWMFLVLPGLALNYMGQGALLMANPAAIENPFFNMFAPAWMIPAVMLSTLAAIIASQAVISGAFSMTKQAVQLGFLPRLKVIYTSASDLGQIYMPVVNYSLFVCVLIVVLVFQSSSALAAAYGIAVTLTMLITTVLTYFVIRHQWHLQNSVAVGATLFFLVLDVFLCLGCLIKFWDGGYMPMMLGIGLYLLMNTWWRGRALMLQSIQAQGVELKSFVEHLDVKQMYCVDRTAVYPVANAQLVPQALLHNMKHNQLIHMRNIVLTVHFEETPWIAPADRVHCQQLSDYFWEVSIKFGFMDDPDVPQALQALAAYGIAVDALSVTYFLSRQTVVPTPGKGMMLWREKLFASMSKNANDAADFFKLPDQNVVELGTRVQI